MEGRQVAALLVLVLVAAGHLKSVQCQLSATFYATSCPTVAAIVRSSISSSVNGSNIVGPSVLRLFAHDCFVDGCDASILIQDSPSLPSQVERDSSDNLSLQQQAFDAITQAKLAVEAQCPGVVSCADILAIAAQDVVNLMGGPAWSVLLGRRDGLTSTASSVPGHLPGSGMTVTQLMGIFGPIGLSMQDLVVLSGAHTVGFAHCKEFANRLYNFNNVAGGTDPSLAASYASVLRGICPNGNFSATSSQALDPQTITQFDNLYFQGLQTGQGLLFSDQILFVDNSTNALVTTYANNQAQFFSDFVRAMLAMSQAGVLTGTQGEIRLQCSTANSAAPVTPPVTPTPPVVTPSPPVVTPTPPVVTPSPPPVVTPSPRPATPSTPKVAAAPPPPGGRRLRRRY